jgi:hypothetical protein
MLNCANAYKLFKTAVVNANGYSVVAARGEPLSQQFVLISQLRF